MAGIPIISKIKSKLKKGETLSGGEKLLVLTWRFLKNLGWMIKHGFKAVGHTIKFIWKVFIDALKTLGLYKFAHAAVVLVLFAGILWFGWDIHQHGLFHPIRVITAKFSPKETVVPTQISIPKPTAPVVASVPTLQPTPTVTKPKTDVADNLLKQAAPDVAGDVAKKLFGI